MMSSTNPSAVVDVMNMNQQAVCVSWCESNSCWRMASALNDRMVGRPFSVAARCVKTGDFAAGSGGQSFIVSEFPEMSHYHHRSDGTQSYHWLPAA